MKRALMVGVAIVAAYLAGVATIPMLLILTADRDTSAGIEKVWTPEEGWTERSVRGPRALVPPDDAKLAGVVGSAGPAPAAP